MVTLLSADAYAAGAGAGAELSSLAPAAGPQHDSSSAVSSAVRQHHPGLLLGRPPAHLDCALAATMRLWARAVLCRPPAVPDKGLTAPLATPVRYGRGGTARCQRFRIPGQA